jgi:hypothetical protein
MTNLRRFLHMVTQQPILSSVVAGLILLGLGWLWQFVHVVITIFQGLLVANHGIPGWTLTMLLLVMVGIGYYAVKTRALLKRSATRPPFERGHNAISLPTGFILVFRDQGFIAALSAVDQRSMSTGASITYSWWYLPDGNATNFHSPDIETGVRTFREGNALEIGPLRVNWSLGKNGLGWIYFGDEMKPPSHYELALTNQVDIQKVDVASLDFKRYVRHAQWYQR